MTKIAAGVIRLLRRDHPEIRSGGTYMRFSFEEDCYVTYSGAVQSFESGTSVVLPLKPASSAAQWGSPEEQSRMRAMLSSSLLFARSLATVQLQAVRGSSAEPALIFRRNLTVSRSIAHEPTPRASSGPGAARLSSRSDGRASRRAHQSRWAAWRSRLSKSRAAAGM